MVIGRQIVAHWARDVAQRTAEGDVSLCDNLTCSAVATIGENELSGFDSRKRRSTGGFAFAARPMEVLNDWRHQRCIPWQACERDEP